ncbi:hypothetical protein MauCBS54593_002101 [Microsporum audouinii]
MATLETIPEEIFLSIFEWLNHSYKTDYLRYLTVSRRWQRAVERFFFQRFSLKNTELSIFAYLFQGMGAHRKAFVKDISLMIELPSYDGDDCQQHEDLNNQIFSIAMLDLFQILETFNEDEAVKRNFRRGVGLELRMSIRSPKDDFCNLDIIKKLRGTYIRLLNHEMLPTLACVSYFIPGRNFYTRTLDPAAGIILASKLKNLGRFMVDYSDSREYISDEMRMKTRPEFARALSNYTNLVSEVKIIAQYSYVTEEANSPPNYVPSSSRVDPMSFAIHKFIQRANISKASITEGHTVSQDIFWPYKSAQDAPVPFWPNLEDIHVCLAPVTPDGDWYFMGDPKIASHSEFIGASRAPKLHNGDNMFRSIPNPERMDPLLKAMASAIRHAPSLKKLDLWFGEDELSPTYVKVEGLKRRFDIFYRAPGEGRVFRDDPKERQLTRRPRIVCDVLHWRASEEIEKCWMEALGPNGAIYYRH